MIKSVPFVIGVIEAGCYVHEDYNGHSLLTTAAALVLSGAGDTDCQIVLSKICSSPNYDVTHYENTLLVLLAVEAGDINEAARLMRNIHFTQRAVKLPFFRRFLRAVEEPSFCGLFGKIVRAVGDLIHEEKSVLYEAARGNQSWLELDKRIILTGGRSARKNSKRKGKKRNSMKKIGGTLRR